MPSAISMRRARKSGGPVVSDSFNRADSSSSLGSADTGQAWSVLQNGSGSQWGISSSKAYCSNAGTSNPHLVAVVDAGVADCTAQATFSTLATANQGLTTRVSTIDNMIMTNVSATTVQTYRLQSGSYTQLASTSVSGASGDVVKVVLSGTSISVFKNGSSVHSVTSSFNQTTTKHGLRTDGSNLSARFDDYTVTVP